MTVEVAPDALLLGFARALRAAGVRVTADRERTFLTAVAAVGMGERSHVYWAGRATLTSTPADFDAYAEVFDRWFGGEDIKPGRRAEVSRPPVVQAPLDTSEGSGGEADDDDSVLIGTDLVPELVELVRATLDEETSHE